MWDHSKIILFKFLIFVSFVHWIRGELPGLKKPTTGTVSKNNDVRTTIKFVTSVDDIFDKKFKSYELAVKEIKASEAEDNFDRRTRDIEPVSLYSKYLESQIISTTEQTTYSIVSTSTLDCYYCSASSASTILDSCYEGGR